MPKPLDVSVAGLLPNDLTALPGILRTEAQTSEGKPLPGLALKIASDKAANAVRSGLNCDVFELLAKGWCVARELQKFRDTKLHPPGERSTVTLGEHRLATTANPTLTITVDSIRLKPLSLTLELAATFETAVLTIVDAHIVSLETGTCTASAQLKYHDIDLHDPLESRKLTLPGRLTFEAPGLPIHGGQETSSRKIRQASPL